MRSGTNASTLNTAWPIGGPFGVGEHVDRPHASRRGERERHGQINRVLRAAVGHPVEEHLAVGPLDDEVRRQIDRLAGGVAQQGHQAHGLAGPIDAAVRPGERVERTRILHALHAAVGQVERRGL